MKEHHARFNAHQLYWYTKGEGPVIILLHGFLENSSMWKNYAAYFSANHKVICIDLPGHGKSAPFKHECSMSLMADAVHFVFKQEQAAIATIIGHSMGGYVTLSFADRYPECLNGFGLFHSTAFPDSEIKQKDRERAIKVLEKNPWIFISEAIPNLFGKTHRAEFALGIEQMKQEALATSIEGATAALRGMKTRKDYTSLLQKTRLPVLFIAGKEDNVTPADKSAAQIAMIKNVYAYLLDDCGHMGFIEQEKICREAIQKFLDVAYGQY